MTELYNIELLYIAGVGLFLNIFLFATTLLIYLLCKPRTESTDLEAFNHLQYQQQQEDHHRDNINHLNVALLHEHDEENGLKLINLIPSLKFEQVVKDHEDDDHHESIRANGCSICLKEGYDKEDLCKVLPECDHLFHGECIDQWLIKNQSCPVCRKIFRVVNPPKV